MEIMYLEVKFCFKLFGVKLAKIFGIDGALYGCFSTIHDLH